MLNNNWIKKYTFIIFTVLVIYFLFNSFSDSKTNNDFEIAFEFVLKWEGGYNESEESKYGITKMFYPNLDIKNLTVDNAKKIYYQDYWLKAGCDKKIFPANIIIFDTAVNMGVNRAKKIYAKSIDWQDYLFKRIEFYAGLKNNKYYLRGWVNRVIDLYKLINKDIKDDRDR